MSNDKGPDEVARRKCDAVRILFIINAAGTTPGKSAPPDAIKELRAEMKLQALDFWVRNPDYLAWEMILLHESDPRAGWLDSAVEVLKNGEPDIRRIAMLRYLFGAWEAVQDAVGTLRTYGLVDQVRKIKGGKPGETSYFLTAKGEQKAAEIAKSAALKWYADRALLVTKVASDRNGSALKKRQHEVEKYHETKHHAYIPPIFEDVKAKLATLHVALP